MQIRKYLMLALATVALAACATPGKYDDLTPQHYINRAASSDTFEVMSGQLALQRSQNPEIIAFAQTMIAEHTQTSQMLMASLSGKTDQTVAIPAPGLMLPEQRDALVRLQTSTMFDRDYVNAQIMAHDEALALHESFAKDSNNDILVKNAKAVIPHVKMHRDMIGQIAAHMQAMPMVQQPAMQPSTMQPMQPVIMQ